VTPLVSVIIPCYRQGHWLATAVQAALGQTHPRVEVVVVNDGSDDNTDEVAQGYSDRIQYVSQSNRGLAAARNAGVRVSAGELLHFLDSDDSLHPDAIRNLVAAASDTHPLVGMGWRPFETDPNVPTGADVLPPPPDQLHRAMLTACYGPPHNFLIGRQIFEQVGGFDERMRGCADWDLWLRLLFAGATPNTTPFVGALYRQSPNQMSRHEMHMAEELARAVSKVPVLVSQHPNRVSAWGFDPAELRREFLKRAVKESADAGYLRRQRGEYRMAAAHYTKCVLAGGYAVGLSGLIKLLPHRLVGKGRRL
jgi:glycosyltransferase involved in cell wall biosynthesis